MGDKAPRNRLTLGPAAMSEEDIIAARRQTWAGWIKECTEARVTLNDLAIEQLLGLIPEKRDD